MIFNLYKTDDDTNVINKILTDELSFDIVLKTATNIYDPDIVIKSDEDLTSYNYAEISYFGRYYFVESVEPKPNGIYNFSLVCDVLESFKEDVFASEELYNNQSVSTIIDIVESDVDVDELLASLDDVSYILTTLGVDYIGGS